MRCVGCDTEMVTRRENHQYTESGLSNVVLVGMEVSCCPECGEIEVSIPAIARLHSLLAGMIADSTERLVPEQIRFLRKHLGWSSVRFADKMGVDRSTVHRWETGESKMPRSAERLLRVLVRFENPISDYHKSIDLECLGIDEPIARELEAILQNGSWRPGGDDGRTSGNPVH